jgi:hypothetical protein
VGRGIQWLILYRYSYSHLFPNQRCDADIFGVEPFWIDDSCGAGLSAADIETALKVVMALTENLKTEAGRN